MKNVVKIEKTAIRIPVELTERMDHLILHTQNYANRPDFIISAVRYAMEWIKDETQIDKDREKICEELTASYNSYNGSPVLIFLRVTMGLASSWENTICSSIGIKNFQDLARLSIPKYISYIESSDCTIKI